jgi:gamma-glutamyl-gamma-aminobutyrate hydrolase PuuD
MSTVLKVAVSQRIDVWTERNERRDALDQRLCQWLTAAGCLPMPVPNSLAGHDEQLQNWLHAMQPDAIVLSGGNDIGAAPERDLTECGLLDYGRDKILPALGICRGMQMMTVWAGGGLAPVSGHVRARHRLQITPNSGTWPVEVNSFHNFALAECPPGFVATARAEDGTIEAMRHETLPWEGWMWHPEREQPFNPTDAMRFRALLELRRTR